MSIVFIDYPEGAGGELISQLVGMHTGCHKPKIELTPEGRANHVDPITRMLNLQRHEHPDNWESVAESYFRQLKGLTKNIKETICIPYHACYHNHTGLLKEIFPDCKIVSIRPLSTEDWDLVAAEIFRKVYLKRSDLKRIKYFYKTFNYKKRTDFKNFFDLDGFLIRQGLDITPENKRIAVDHIMKLRISHWNHADYIISWHNLFGTTEHIPQEYVGLCKFLGLTPNPAALEFLTEKNIKNLNDLKKYNLETELNTYFNITLQPNVKA